MEGKGAEKMKNADFLKKLSEKFVQSEYLCYLCIRK